MTTSKHWLDTVLAVLSVVGKIFRAIVRIFTKKDKKNKDNE